MTRPLVLAACLSLAVSGAKAATLSPASGDGMGCVLRLEGQIAQGDAEALTAELDRLVDLRQPGSGPVGARLCLDSPGGSLVEAVLMADAVAARGFGTAVPAGATCESACAVLFMAGQHRPPETDIPFSPDRILHPQGRLGFHAPKLTVPEGAYTEAEVDRAYGIALASMAEVIRLRARRGLVFPDSLLLALIGTPAASMTRVETVGQAARWQIEIAPVALPTEALPQALSHACLNADGGMLDSAPSESWYHGQTLSFRFDGFGADHAELRSQEGFREEGAAPCGLYLQAPGDAITAIGAVTMEGGAPTSPTWRGLYPFAFYDPDRRIDSLPLAEGATSGPFLDALAGMARQALAAVRFESCWLAAPDATVVNVETFVNLRGAAGFDGPVLREVPLGERLRVLGTQSLHTPVSPALSESCLAACNALAMAPDDSGARAEVDRCIDRNALWYEVRDSEGRTGFISRKYLSD